jgi:hypothetical protein
MSKSKGQVSIFLIFIFHILFLFFAMIINVGMLVHHKINLQNSVDLAAYYGAMKQSEILGAIAHINYQIRQSWKLMNFRYHMLGGIGADDAPGRHPNIVSDDIAEARPSVFCMTSDSIYNTGNSLSRDNNTCRQATERMTIAAMKVPDFVGAIALHRQVAEQIRLAREVGDRDFVNGGSRNFRLLTLFVVLFRTDVKNRKLVIKKLAENLSASDEDFSDLDGNSTFDGVIKTFVNNLTEDNKRGRELKFYNSMGNLNCSRSPGANFPPKWLRQITVLPLYIYYDTIINEGNDDERMEGRFAYLNRLPDGINSTNLDTDQKVFLQNMQDLANPLQVEEQNLYDIVGVEKNPWCLTYSGVSAVSTPSLPFMPGTIRIQLKASAYAKPFGGKIGPWYESTWARSDDRSKGGRKIDETLLLRFEDKAAINGEQIKDYKSRMPNFSRYPGDKEGIISLQAKKAYGEKIFLTSLRLNNNQYDTNAWLNKTNNLMPSQSNPLIDLPMMPENLDILADEKTVDRVTISGGEQLRQLEIMSIAPDLFDIAYYSIEPNFWYLYLGRLKALMPNLFPRGDLGSSANMPFSVKDQMFRVGNNALEMNFSGTGLYQTITSSKLNDESNPIWGSLLTNWTEKSLLDYNIDEVKRDMFGKCPEPIPQNLQIQNPTQGECLTGGRTGYSVKLVSKKFLNRSDLVLGGIGTSGAILNPPPNNFER